MKRINELSVIHPDAKIGNNVEIGPFVNIEEDVIIGDNTKIGSGVSLMNGTRIGKNCTVFPGAVLGAVPQDLKFHGEYSTLEIGDNVTIREYCTLNRGTEASGKTVIGNNNLLMAYTHVAHDCIIGNNCILANNTALAGHIEIDDFAILGGLVAVHQFVKIGAHVMVGGGSLVSQDIPPYIKVSKRPLAYIGINSIGLARRGFTKEQIERIHNIYRTLYQKGYNTTNAVNVIKENTDDSPEKNEVLSFLERSTRGIVKGSR